MTTTVRAVFDGSVLVPEGIVDLPTGTELELEVRVANPKVLTPPNLRDLANLYPSNPESPTDRAAQHDHYLYGNGSPRDYQGASIRSPFRAGRFRGSA